MSVRGASKKIVDTLLTWDGMETHPHRFGGTEFRIGKREIGHIHGDSLVDIPFPKKVRDEIVAAGEAQPHHILPETGWVSFYLREEGDMERAIALLKRSYEIALKQKSRNLIQFQIPIFIKRKERIVRHFPAIIIGVGKIGTVSAPKYFLRFLDDLHAF